MNWIKKNIVVIVYILTIISDFIFEVSKSLEFTNNQLNLLKLAGAIVAVLLAQTQAIIVEKTSKK